MVAPRVPDWRGEPLGALRRHSWALPMGPPAEQKLQGQADTPEQMEILPRVLDVRGAVPGDGGCLLPPRTTGHGALGKVVSWIHPAPLAGGMAAPVARAGLPGTAKTPARSRGQPCRHLSLSLLQRGSCPETQRCLRPGGAGVPSPPARAFHRGLAPWPPKRAGTAPLQPPAWASLRSTSPTAGTGTVLHPAMGHGARCCPLTPGHPAHPSSSRGSMWH